VAQVDIQVQVIDLGFVNAFLVRTGEGYVLIDTGIGQQWAQLENELLKAGCLPGKLQLVVVTHGDFDHTGNCGRLQKKYQAKIAMHRDDVAMVKTGVSPKRHTRGWAARLMEFAGKLLSRGGRFDTFEPDIVLEGGQSLNAYGLAAKVFHTPGHTKGAIALLTDQGQLFPGDTVSNRGQPDAAPFVDDYGQLRASLAALKAMKVKVVYPGHGKPFPGEMLANIEV
jgi:hydroxyacylglutathione hydrolase